METKKTDSSRIPKSGRIKFYIFNCLLDRGHSSLRGLFIYNLLANSNLIISGYVHYKTRLLRSSSNISNCLGAITK